MISKINHSFLVKAILFCLLLSGCVHVNVHSQFAIRFFNEAKEKAVFLTRGDHVKFEYKGYLEQIEFAEGYLIEINDSLLVLGDPSFGKVKDRKTIAIHDLQGFRKFTIFRDVSKSLLQVGIVFGSYFLLKEIYRNNSFTPLEDLGISFGVGLSLAFLIKLIYPENIKNRIGEGWSLSLIDPLGHSIDIYQ